MARTLAGAVYYLIDANTGLKVADDDGRLHSGEEYQILKQETDRWGRKWYQVIGPSGELDILNGSNNNLHRDCMESDDQTLSQWLEKYAEEN